MTISCQLQRVSNGFLLAVGGEPGLLGMVREPRIYIASTFGELEALLRQVFDIEDRTPVPQVFDEAFAEPEPKPEPKGEPYAAPYSQDAILSAFVRRAQGEPEPEPDPEPPPKPKKPKHK